MSFLPQDLPDVEYDRVLPDRLQLCSLNSSQETIPTHGFPCRAFFVASAIIAVIIFVKEYADIAVEAVDRYPKILCLLYLFGAYVFAYIVCRVLGRCADPSFSNRIIHNW
jgi:hypothetical protein